MSSGEELFRGGGKEKAPRSPVLGTGPRGAFASSECELSGDAELAALDVHGGVVGVEQRLAQPGALDQDLNLLRRAGRRLVEPVQKPADRRRLAEALVDLEAELGEVLLDLRDGLQALALPAAEADAAGRLDRPVLQPLQRRRRRRRALLQPWVVAQQRL